MAERAKNRRSTVKDGVEDRVRLQDGLLGRTSAPPRAAGELERTAMS
jgi:hypothetical protein